MAALLIIGGRQIRVLMLVDDHGAWKESLWLDKLVLPAPAIASDGPPKKSKPMLTSALPINCCSVDSLTLLPGVGKVMAQRIDEARRQGLIFTCASDLEKIKGIGKKLSSRLDTLVLYQLGPNDPKPNPDSETFEDSP